MIGVTAIFAHPMPLAAVTAIFGWWLFLLAALDLEHEWLPDRLTWPLLAAGLAAAWGGFGPPLESRLIGAAAGFASLFAIARLYRAVRGREGLGGGDPKLFAAIGAWLGWTQLPFVLVGAGLLGLAALLLKRVRGEAVAATDRLPLGDLDGARRLADLDRHSAVIIAYPQAACAAAEKLKVSPPGESWAEGRQNIVTTVEFYRGRATRGRGLRVDAFSL